MRYVSPLLGVVSLSFAIWIGAIQPALSQEEARLGEGFDLDQARGLHRNCLKVEMPDGSDPYLFFNPNAGDLQIYYDLTAAQLLDKFAIGVQGSIGFSSVKADGHFAWSTEMGRDDFSETITFAQTATDGLLQMNPGAAVSLNELGEKALQAGADARRLCGQRYVSAKTLSRGYIATLKISYNKKDDLLDLDGHLNVDLKKISIGGEFWYKLHERAAQGDVSLQVHAWGGDVSRLTEGISDDMMFCNRQQWKPGSANDQLASACVRAVSRLIDNGRNFVNQALTGSALDKAEQLRTDQLQFRPYRTLVPADDPRRWTVRELTDAERRHIGISLGEVRSDRLDIESAQARARHILANSADLPLDQRQALGRFMTGAQKLLDDIATIASVCIREIPVPTHCRSEEKLWHGRVSEFLQAQPTDLFQVDFQSFVVWCEKLRANSSLKAAPRDTIMALIEDNLLAGRSWNSLTSAEQQCDRFASGLGRNRQLTWNAGRGLPDFRVLGSLRHVQSVNMSGSRILDSHLNEFKIWPFLRELNLDQSLVTDGHPLLKLPNLKRLSLRQTPLNQLISLNGWKTLEYLDVSGSELIYLNATLPRLREIHLEGTRPADLLSFLNRHTARLEKVGLDRSVVQAQPTLSCDVPFGKIQIICAGESR